MSMHIIYTASGMFLSKTAYSSWQAIQSDFSDYMTSLGPWDAETVTEYLRDEYPTLAPPAALQVSALLQSDAELATLTFAERVAKERDTCIDASEVIRGLRAKLAAAKSKQSCLPGGHH